MRRRDILTQSATGLAALNHLLSAKTTGGQTGMPTHKPTAKRVIYLFQSGGPSQFETFDYKPRLAELAGSTCPRASARVSG